MKWIKRIFLGLVVVVLLLIIAGYFWLNSSRPEYTGNLGLSGLHSPVDVHFDEYGVPHIYAQDKHDLYMAFGYVHAQDRLFQMEMLRRAGSGRLAEIIGRSVLKVDLLFRTLGLPEYAKTSAERLRNGTNDAMKQDIDAYLEGINTYVHNGKTPPEFSLIGIEKTDFTLEDIFCITGAMSFSFSQAQKTDPVVNLIHTKFGDAYLKDIALWHQENESYIPSDGRIGKDSIFSSTTSMHGNDIMLEFAKAMNEIESCIPFAPLEGSNSWVVAPQRTASGKVLFCNDTHIGYMLPQTWYEAHLNAPGFEMYGHFMGAVPFALVGRNRELSWGLTMLLNGDMDFYSEKINPENEQQFLYNGNWEDAKRVHQAIKIKGESDTTFNVFFTRHGPIISSIFDGFDKSQHISMFWTYTKKENKTVDAFYGMNNSKDIVAFEKNLSLIHAPGLNVNYGDASGNIAWWACASLLDRAEKVNSWTLLDGSTSATEPKGYFDFSENPHSVNPAKGYIYSANDWPEKIDSIWYPGYYKPQYRGDRIRTLLEESNQWSLESMKAVMTDNRNTTDESMMKVFADIIRSNPKFEQLPERSMYQSLFDWDGSYSEDLFAPTFYNMMLYYYLHGACADELGEDAFQIFLTTHQVQRGMSILLYSEDSPWWDNVLTEAKENRSDIIYAAFEKSIDKLSAEYGENVKVWTWRKSCTLTLKHPMGEVAAFRPLFNIGPHHVDGANETILQSGFKLDSTGHFNVFFGSQMRIMVDFSDVDNSLNITPSGQSGHLISEHYADQANMYRSKKFRAQLMNEEKIRNFEKLQLLPKN